MNNPGINNSLRDVILNRRAGVEQGWNNARRCFTDRSQTLSEEDIHGVLSWTLGNMDILKQALKKDPSYISFMVDLQMLVCWWSEPERNIDSFYKQYPAVRMSSFLDFLNDA